MEKNTRKYSLFNTKRARNRNLCVDKQKGISALPASLERLFHITTPGDWLKSLIDLYNEFGESLPGLFQVYLFHYPEKTAIWENVFTSAVFIQWFNGLFYLKLYPEKLFETQGSSEPVLSASSRLFTVYQLIEQLQNHILHKPDQGQLHKTNDLLMHGDEIPDSVIIAPDNKLKTEILALIKGMRTSSVPAEDEQMLYMKLYDLLRAYKIWFNPSRLVDAVMVLQQKLQQRNIKQNFDSDLFKDNMKRLYQHLKTTECVDLYGYFNNKDTLYFLRLLHAVTENQSAAWLPECTVLGKCAVRRVFHSLLTMIDALKEVLFERGISTASAQPNYFKSAGNPGKRKYRAIQRIIHLYGIQPIESNSSIEALFDSIETD